MQYLSTAAKTGGIEGDISTESFPVSLSSVFQPILDLRRSSVYGSEALARACHEDGSQLPIAELFMARSVAGRIKLDIRCHLEHLKNANSFLKSHETLFLNARPETLMAERYAGNLARSVRDAGIHPEQVVIEILEGEAMVNQLGSAIREYRELGFVIALDDFGVGFSNLDRVFKMLPDLIKLDQTLLSAASNGETEFRLYCSLIELLHQAGMRVVAEGVDTAEKLQLAILSKADMAQGYYLERPHRIRKVPESSLACINFDPK